MHTVICAHGHHDVTSASAADLASGVGATPTDKYSDVMHTIAPSVPIKALPIRQTAMATGNWLHGSCWEFTLYWSMHGVTKVEIEGLSKYKGKCLQEKNIS